MIRLQKHKNACRAGLFAVISLIIYGCLNFVFQPVWLEWNNYDTIQGFYEQPENTIETVFLGASIVVNGVTPMELYEDYGICAWNLATEQQPMLASYYWLAEAYRYHPESLKTAVLDMSMLRNVPDEAFYQKALSSMKFSENKCQAIKDCVDTFDDFIAYLIPMFSYHTRWKELDITDFESFGYDINSSVRGYHFVTESVIDSYSYDEIGIPTYISDENEGEFEFKNEPLLYLKQMIDFCKEHNIELILMKTPGSSNWSDAAHNAVQEMAEDYDLTFIDFNYSPYLEEVQYTEATDSVDMGHMNYYGATKLTDWFGNYLTEFCGATDVRQTEKYAFMDEELEEYHREILSIELNDIKDPCEYIETVNRYGNYTILISVKDEGAGALTDTQRETFKLLGLPKLAELQYRGSYLAVIENGQVQYEELEYDKGEENAGIVTDDEKINDLKSIEYILTEELLSETNDETESPLYLEYEGAMPDGTQFTLRSGGIYMGDLSSCVINGTEYSVNQRGINIVVYDNERGQVADSTSFDTCASPTRTSQNLEDALQEALESGTDPSDLTDQLKQLYLYNCRCADSYKVKRLRSQIDVTEGSGLYQYLSAFWNDEDYAVFLSVQDDAAVLLDEDDRNQVAGLGLIELSRIAYGDSYLAVIDGGNVVTEACDHGAVPLQAEGIVYQLVSGGINSGSVSSIKIGDAEYSLNARGLNVVVYNKLTEEVVDSIVFDSDIYSVSMD